MRRRGPDLSAYRGMWLFAMFDLPTDSDRAKKAYVRFRKLLLGHGFIMLQYSVYARHCASEDSTAIIRQSIRGQLPDDGQVRLVAVTDRQYGKMEVFCGKKRDITEDPPAQIMLF